MREENQTIIKALNMFGRVPETWELLNEIERLNNTFNKITKIIDSDEYFGDKYDCIVYLITKDESYLSQYTPEELLHIINGGDVE